MRHEIYRVLDVDACHNAETGEAIPYLTREGEVYGEAKLLSAGGADATLEELVGLCDQDAESCNAHDFCGAHRLLGAVLFRQYGRDSATATMLHVALLGGLHGMNGVCAEGDAYAELGVGESGYDWDGNYDDIGPWDAQYKEA
jgi:hypothetical protein